MSIAEKFKNYISIYSEIMSMFDVKGHWEQIEDHTEVRWHLSGGDTESWINYLDENGTEYGYEYASECGNAVDGLRLFYVQDNGEKFFVMMSDSNLIEDYDEFCEQMGVEHAE